MKIDVIRSLDLNYTSHQIAEIRKHFRRHLGECEWKEDEDGVWDTSCGNRFVLEAETPSANEMRFCTYCGKTLKETSGPVGEEKGGDRG